MAADSDLFKNNFKYAFLKAILYIFGASIRISIILYNNYNRALKLIYNIDESNF